VGNATSGLEARDAENKVTEECRSEAVGLDTRGVGMVNEESDGERISRSGARWLSHRCVDFARDSSESGATD
jgi:hypothetical protein